MRSFAENMRVRAQKVTDNSDRLMRRVALAVDTAVVMGTPVLTGRARSNWQVGLNAPVNSVKYPAPDKPASPEAGMAEALTTGQQAVAQYKGSDGEGEIHITNNLPYIKKLNDGWSRQAPAGYVEKATIAAKNAIDTAGELTATVVTERI